MTTLNDPEIKCDTCDHLTNDFLGCIKGNTAWEPGCKDYKEKGSNVVSPPVTTKGKGKIRAIKWKDEDIEFYVHK